MIEPLHQEPYIAHCASGELSIAEGYSWYVLMGWYFYELMGGHDTVTLYWYDLSMN